MASQALFMPDAPDADVLAVRPTQELQSCNHLLEDHAALMRFHDEEGYILLRGVLDPVSVLEARDAMLAVAARHGLVAPGDASATWTGMAAPAGMEESPEFSGIARKLVANPANAALFHTVLGEPAALLPIVQYRVYPPGGSITGIHQDGFFSPGIVNYRPVWTPLTPCEREVGGLMVAVRQCNRGYLHNVAKTPSPVPAGVIPDDAWATTDYFPGDVLMINPYTPHASMPNTSKRCRVTLDTRVQSATDPRVLLAEIIEAREDEIRVRTSDGVERCFRVDDDTFIRVDHPGVRQKRNEYVPTAPVGKRIVVVFDGDHAVTLRRSSEN
ncbi:phytanoyl-CoA dioxygenase family protein [Novosphingobium taihuense]|uniref:Ectoine hydroxylase-related dioxygenase (Phytanoyl-CoA dioxygenase family) n=1 Tax=Novosphingobium taihuense TaxID=260085 RepID=A0A7W7AEE2_9SPHN|nr:phytanoyl-CoA dioxygenase family protein [Novosphingobium taihuense]MBB4615474.1 ectoine hydroxylase-related dioxygenase (phytanoyl-CoA dioxygenase family) [Novosphingobium taihuense]TWH82079.1 1-deoxypentalenic acid 11beta-hydroxylase [Novosphingobium taihuense]